MVKIHTVATAVPSISRSTDDIIPLISQWLNGQDDRLQRKAKKIFRNAGVDHRYSMLKPDEVFSTSEFADRNDIYIKESISLAKIAMQRALDKANWVADEIDFLITVSCTGIMIPSIDAYLINAFDMPQNTVRLPVTEMGCAAGVSGIIYATNFLKANPEKRAAVVAVESPMATFQTDDYSMVNIVSAAIFGDGAACALLSSKEEDIGPEVIHHEMYHFFDSTELMGFDLRKGGLHMVLDQSVPDKIEEHFEHIIHPFLSQIDLSIQDIEHLIFHPGGKKIVQIVETLFGELGKSIEDTKEVLRLFGNMSSATVLFVLERFMNGELESGSYGLMLSFGPGFSAQRVLLKW